MSIEEIESQRIPLAERMVREPFWLGLITVLVVMIVIGVGYLVKKHLPEKIEKLLRTNQEAAMASGPLDQNISGRVFHNIAFHRITLCYIQNVYIVYYIYSQWPNIILL